VGIELGRASRLELSLGLLLTMGGVRLAVATTKNVLDGLSQSCQGRNGR
jgi:hypothetical protein